MTDELPETSITTDIDLRGLPYMPVYIERLQKSKAWLMCKRRPDLAFYLWNLWMRAWHEVPAGSLEDDDDVLADAAMCEPKHWAKIKTDILRGWEIGADGRLYHKTMVEFAAEVWQKRCSYRQRTETARAAKKQKRDKADKGNAKEPIKEPVTEIVAEIAKEPETKVIKEPVTALKGREEKRREEKDSGAKAPGAAAPLDLLEIPLIQVRPRDGDWSIALFRQGLTWLSGVYRVSQDKLRSLIGHWLRLAGGDHKRVFDLLARCQIENIADPKGWITAQLGGKHDEKSPEFNNGFAELIAKGGV